MSNQKPNFGVLVFFRCHRRPVTRLLEVGVLIQLDRSRKRALRPVQGVRQEVFRRIYLSKNSYSDETTLGILVTAIKKSKKCNFRTLPIQRGLALSLLPLFWEGASPSKTRHFKQSKIRFPVIVVPDFNQKRHKLNFTEISKYVILKGQNNAAKKGHFSAHV